MTTSSLYLPKTVRARLLPAAVFVLLSQGAAMAGPSAGDSIDDDLVYWMRLQGMAANRFVLSEAPAQTRAMENYFRVYDDGSHHAQATGLRSLAAGYGAVSSAVDSAAIGRDAVASGFESLAVGSRTVSATGAASVAVGNNIFNEADYTVAFGAGTRSGVTTIDAASRESFMVVSNGLGSLTNAAQAVAILASVTNANQGIGIGAHAVVTASAGIALGAHAVASASDAVALGAGAVADRGSAVSIGSSTRRRQLINLANGTADSDAGTTGQLRAAVSALGGNAAIDGNGALVAPVYTVQGQSARNVGDALAVIDAGVTYNASALQILGGRVGVNEGAISNIVDDVDLINDTITRAAYYDDATKGAITFAGVTGTQLKNVADGSDDTDAVNLRQLRAAGLVGPGGEAIAAVVYNDDKSIVTLTGVGGSSLTGLRDGSIDAASTDAINGRQLFALDQRIGVNETDIGILQNDVVDINGTLTRAAYYDDVSKGAITFAGAGGTQLKNVADGSDDTDAVNLRQLRSAGLVGPGGDVISAVTYNDDKSMVSLAGIGGTGMTNLRAGAVAAGSTDAINGGQLWAMREEFDGRFDIVENRIINIENHLGAIDNTLIEIINGDIGFSVDGNGIDSTQVGTGAVANGDYATATGVGAIAAGERSTAIGQGAQATAEGSTALGAGAQAMASGSVALGDGSVADRDNTVSIGNAGQERQLTNVAAGVFDTDGVNVAQLKETRDWAQQYIDDRTAVLDRRIEQVNRRAAAGSATAIAMANMPQPYAAGQSAASAGVGTFNGQSAVALGLSTISASGLWQYRLSGARSTDGTTGAGFGLARVW